MLFRQKFITQGNNMILLTLKVSDKRFLQYETESAHATVIAEFLLMDVAHIPDFIRDLLNKSGSNQLLMDACQINTDGGTVSLKHRWLEDLPTVMLPKERLLEIIDLWQEFLMEQRSLQWIMFDEEEFGLPPATDEASIKLRNIQEDLKKRFSGMQQD